MMEQVTSGSKKGTKQLLRMLPGLRSEDESSQDFRLLLHQYTKQLKAVSETPLRYGYHLPNFTQKCFACGRCEKSCRSGAIKFEDLPDGRPRGDHAVEVQRVRGRALPPAPTAVWTA